MSVYSDAFSAEMTWGIMLASLFSDSITGARSRCKSHKRET